jgi:phosphoribosyl 1,2-cyclic phosphodiesterase
MNSNETFTVKFWGVRGSYPTPGAGTVGYGGNTACVEVRLGGQVVILDAGTGIIPLGRDLMRRASVVTRPLSLTILISHLHHDHTQGFPFFVPAFVPSARLRIYGPGTSEESLQKVLEHNQDPVTFPISLRDMGAQKEIRSLRESDVIYLDPVEGVGSAKTGYGSDSARACIRIHRSYAHPGGCFAYRIDWRGRSLVYATDTEGYAGGDRRLAAFARGADLLIHDAQYSEEHYRGQMTGAPSTQGYGHSTVEMACELAAMAGVKQLALFHHDPSYDDSMVAALESRAKESFENSFAAAEGLALDLPEAQDHAFLTAARPEVRAGIGKEG